jgi:eukaryotic-like serine/threonine-protein kinase
MVSPPTSRDLLRTGYRLDGRYELLFPYAQGGMATVWVARVQGKHGFEKLFAVKTILPHLAADKSFRSMFLDEARIVSRIRHANVAEVEDLGEDAGHLYMVLEWIQGDPWSKLRTGLEERGDRVPVDLMLRIAADACAGLHAAHELTDDLGRSLSVVHRDVSPQNVMVTEAGAVKVIDFGVAKALGRVSESTGTGVIKGKLEYLSPELAMGREVDRRTDVWALGATLYEIFAGTPPFVGRNDLEVLKLLSMGKPPAPLDGHVTPKVAEVIMACLQPDVARRVPNALTLQRMLEGAMSAPMPPEEVARAVRQVLSVSIKSRHDSIAEALRQAARRTPTLAGVGPNDLPPRPEQVSFPVLPPEAAPVRGTQEVVVPRLAANLGRWNDATVAAEPTTEALSNPPPLQTVHKVWIVVATLVTVSVWATVLARALGG